MSTGRTAITIMGTKGTRTGDERGRNPVASAFGVAARRLASAAFAQCLWSFDDIWFFLLPIPLAILALVWLALAVRSVIARLREYGKAVAALGRELINRIHKAA